MPEQLIGGGDTGAADTGGTGGDPAETNAPAPAGDVVNIENPMGDQDSNQQAPPPDGSQQPAEPWYEQLQISPQLRNDPNIRKYKSVEAALEAIPNLARKLGDKGLIQPGENATPEEWTAFYEKAGRPETAEGYDWTAPQTEDGNPLIAELDQDSLKEMKEWAHQEGYRPEHFSKMMDRLVTFENSREQAKLEALSAEGVETSKILMKEWGENLEPRLKSIDAFMQSKYPEAQEAIRAGAIGNNAAVLKMAYDLMSRAQPTNLPASIPKNLGGSVDDQIRTLKESPAYKDPGHRDHSQAHKQLIDLYMAKG